MKKNPCGNCALRMAGIECGYCETIKMIQLRIIMKRLKNNGLKKKTRNK